MTYGKTRKIRFRGVEHYVNFNILAFLWHLPAHIVAARRYRKVSKKCSG
jgi:hypothetical protein